MKALLRFCVHNPVLMNLLMITVMVAGGWSAIVIIREMFPESRPNRVLVTTAYPGASPVEIENGITHKIEERVRNVQGVAEVKSTATEGYSRILVEMESGFDDIDQAVNDIKAAVDTIPLDDFPDEAEKTSVTKFQPTWPVIGVAIRGDIDGHELRRIGMELRDEILEIPGITDVLLTGTRGDELSVEVNPTKLVEYGLSLLDVGQAIATGNLDLPAGQLKTPRANVSVRTLGETDQREKLEEMVIRSDPHGRVVRVGDVAAVVDGFENVDIFSRYLGRRAANITVYKTPKQDALAIASRVRALVAGKTGQPLRPGWWERAFGPLLRDTVVQRVYDRAHGNPIPSELALSIHTDLSRFIEDRIDLLKRNGAWGLVLVALSLVVFLHWTVALWVIVGVALSLGGAITGLHLVGYSLNMFSMLGLIVVLGMLVDDAIIVGENVFRRVEDGLAPNLAAVEGTREVSWPVICAVVTTVVAFLPLTFIRGQVGDWMGVLPVVVCLALIASVVEALTILPCHLAHGLRPRRQRDARTPSPPSRSVRAAGNRVRDWQHRLVQEHLMPWYERTLRVCVGYRYVTMAGLVAMLLVAGGAVAGGHVPFVFLEKMDTETLTIDLAMEVGAPIDATEEAAARLERAVMELPELRTLYTIIGTQLDDEQAATAPQSHLGQLWIELCPADERTRTSSEIIQALRNTTGDIIGVRELKFSGMDGGPAGAPIHLEISTSGDLNALAAIASHIRAKLSGFEGAYDIVDDNETGRREVQIELLESGRALGFTTQGLAAQVRAAFYGFEARKVLRGREEIPIVVRFAADYRQRISDIEEMWIAAPGGALVPMTEVASVRETTGFASIRRVNQRRTITVTADIDTNVTTADRIIAMLSVDFDDFIAAHPGLEFRFGGQKLETQKAFGSLQKDFMAAVAMIYVILAGLFRSYVQPFVVMAVIPFGFIGAVFGHYLFGIPLTILSMIGLVALAGIVVNDSMLLVTFVNRLAAAGLPPTEAVVEGGKRRLRAILLTTATTVLGIAPLLSETSFQARFLIPMAVSISAGLVFATVLTLVIVPCLYVIADDARTAFFIGRARIGWRRPRRTRTVSL